MSNADKRAPVATRIQQNILARGERRLVVFEALVEQVCNRRVVAFGSRNLKG